MRIVEVLQDIYVDEVIHLSNTIDVHLGTSLRVKTHLGTDQ